MVCSQQGSGTLHVFVFQAKEREQRTLRRQQRRAELLAKKKEKSAARKSAKEQERKAKQAVQELKKQLGEEHKGCYCFISATICVCILLINVTGS